MLLCFFSFLIAFCLVALAQAERRLPADLQVDILFPRNETYAPTQRFPIVVGIQNLDAVWPLNTMILYLDVLSLEAHRKKEESLWQQAYLGISSGMFPDKVGPDPPRQFLYYPTINMTNGTTDQMVLRWAVTIQKRCYGNSSHEDGGYGWDSGAGLDTYRQIIFSTAPGGQSPDVAATLDACPEGGENTTATIRVTGMGSTGNFQEHCPIFDPGVHPTRCAYRDVAQEVAANVSADIMKRIGCDDGTWQNITAPTGVTVAQLAAWNTQIGGGACTGIWAGYNICTGVIGGTPTPQPIQDGMMGNCKRFHFVQPGQNCDIISRQYGITVASFIRWNPAAGANCQGLWAQTYACVGL
ncbi:LysM domain-containing protein-like protein 5 [Colletotrichum sojae]|uniref:LysM domain-containing protein-like protein 5 n=1 Tax=Colletotrichum sojae TaxID=2175907 RepID=A0A8H6MK29_9PEZI|nr:LysM domain-containing protein-like protein 5 [Colletotrichum sojae]